MCCRFSATVDASDGGEARRGATEREREEWLGAGETGPGDDGGGATHGDGESAGGEEERDGRPAQTDRSHQQAARRQPQVPRSK